MKIFEYKLKKNKKAAGITAMSIVDDPAVLVNFLKLSKEEKVIKLSMNSDQMIVTGPALIPNLKIFRNAQSLGMEEDGYIFFSEETVKEMAHLFMLNENMNNITLGHETDSKDLKLIESWIVDDPKIDKALSLGFEVPKGTWMVSYKVENKELWNKIKEGEFNGFSIEAKDFEIYEDSEIAMAKEEVELDEETAAKIIIFELLELAKPNPGESEEEFLPRCIKTVLDDGTADDEKQAYAICKGYYSIVNQ